MLIIGLKPTILLEILYSVEAAAVSPVLRASSFSM